jgi:hypothetical protein
MSIKSKADWLRGFIESLDYSDTISKRQIQVLKEKLNLLLEEIEENDFEEAEDDDFIENQSSNNSSNTGSSFWIGDDDLPF